MKKSDKEEVKSLWKKCFNDSDEFIDLYFRRRYYDDINMALFYDDKLISALQMIPYEMTFYGEKIRASYISGAATDPDYRNRGAMAQLLKDSHQRMYEKGVSLSFLIPAGDGLFDYYSKFGFETIFFSKFIKGGNLALDKDFSLQVELCEEVDEYIYNYLYDRMLALPSAVLHNYEDLSIVMDDIKLAGGKIVKASRNDSICGVSFAVPVEKDVIIKALDRVEEYNINSVVKLLFENLNPYISLMMD